MANPAVQTARDRIQALADKARQDAERAFDESGACASSTMRLAHRALGQRHEARALAYEEALAILGQEG